LWPEDSPLVFPSIWLERKGGFPKKDGFSFLPDFQRIFSKMELREYIALRRKSLGISQSEIASAMGYTDTAVSKIESGASTPPISILPSLANILQISLHDLLVMKEDPAPLKSPNPPYDWKTVSLNLRAIRLWPSICGKKRRRRRSGSTNGRW
jgi:transcriptional regulator with XRE-family HTH domain